jgi:D-cysteine desulfhydrase
MNRGPRDHVIHIGGVGIAATLAYAAAAQELADDVAAGLLPAPERIVVPLGTGSTVAGLLAGLVQTPLRSVLVGVAVAPNPAARLLVLALAARALQVSGKTYLIPQLARRLLVDGTRVGAGYGHPTPEGARATELAAILGIELEPTYTAKAFSRALAEAGFAEFSRDFARERLEGPRRTLYWHTLSALPLGPLEGARTGSTEIPKSHRSLFLDPPLAEAPRR